MASITDYLYKRGLINSIPQHILNSVCYEVITGSVAYGVSTDTSDMDVYGFCIPHKDMVFPHLRGEIIGFGRQIKRFEQFQMHHIKDEEGRKEYDLTIYNIVKYFGLCMENNPNMIDSLFVPQRAILHCDHVGSMVRENRKIFLHKGSWFKFKGYAFSQLHKIRTKHNQAKFIHNFEIIHNLDHETTPEQAQLLLNDDRFNKQEVQKYVQSVNSLYENGYKRAHLVRVHGFDFKFAYHVVRLLNEVEQILIEHDLDLERNREQLKSIRRGEWTFDQILDYFEQKEKALEELYTKSDLRHSPDEDSIKELLLNCLEHKFGNLNSVVSRQDLGSKILNDLELLVQKYK